MSKRRFRNGDFLAVVGDDKQYWLCKCRQHVYEGKTQTFWVQWLEKEEATYKSADLKNIDVSIVYIIMCIY